MTHAMMLGLVFAVNFAAVLALLILLSRARHPAVRRIAELETDASGPDRGGGARLERGRSRIGFLSVIFKALSGSVRTDDRRQARLRTALGQAGYSREDSVRVFTGARMFSTAVFAVLALTAGLIGRRPIPNALLMACASALGGYLLPRIVLNRRINRRQEQIARSLPDAIDLLVISVEAGLGLNAALLRVGQDMAVRCRPISEEFGRVNQELRTGSSREKALRNLSDRNRVEDLRIFVGALILTDRLGTSIADTLRVQADSLRTRLRQKAEEQAAKAGIKLLFPLVFFILPALIIILMGPAVISVIRTFRP
ncbi:type II secretion system F family protein [bacterium]|nr:type II secretion system F family protein [bacterium]